MPIRTCARSGLLAGILLLCHTASAQDVTSLQKCLAAFDGIIWSLPYSPRLTAGNCSADGSGARIEFFSHRLLDADEHGLDHDVRFADEKKAAFAHFETLFGQHGYQLDQTVIATDSSAPYVQRARFVRAGSRGDLELVYETVAANAYRLTLQAATGARP